MARLASRCRPVGAYCLHSLLELPLMRILMATGAGQVLPVVNDRRFGREVRGFLVAIATWNGDVPVGEQEARFLVTRQRKRGWLVTLQIVAAVTSIEIWRGGKLTGMPIAVAIGAALEFDFEYRFLSPRNVALCALQPGMSALQRICTQGVLFHRKCRWLPAIDGMAGRTLSTISPLAELAMMRIVVVAVHALGEDHRLLEVAVGVTTNAVHGRVFAQQRELGFRMIEAFADRGG